MGVECPDPGRRCPTVEKKLRVKRELRMWELFPVRIDSLIKSSDHKDAPSGVRDVREELP